MGAKADELSMSEFPNVLVLSAGGYGHVPVPLFKQDEALNNRKPVEDRSIFLSYVGSLRHAPRRMRMIMNKFFSDRNGSIDVGDGKTFYEYHYGDEWRNVMAGQ